MKYVIDGKRTQVYTTHQGQRGRDGKDGSSIESVEFVGQSEIGNTYRMIFSDGHSYDFTAPRGTKGKDGKDGKDGLQGELGVTPVTVSKWCSQKTQPDLKTLSRIAVLLEVDKRELLTED